MLFSVVLVLRLAQAGPDSRCYVLDVVDVVANPILEVTLHLGVYLVLDFGISHADVEAVERELSGLRPAATLVSVVNSSADVGELLFCHRMVILCCFEMPHYKHIQASCQRRKAALGPPSVG